MQLKNVFFTFSSNAMYKIDLSVFKTTVLKLYIKFEKNWYFILLYAQAEHHRK